MGLHLKTTDELVKIASAGAGLVLEVGKRNADELTRIAAAAKRAGGLIVFRNIAVRKTETLEKIAQAGKGHVIFES
jgi:hypothetical protein